jgi:hypothetical protein
MMRRAAITKTFYKQPAVRSPQPAAGSQSRLLLIRQPPLHKRFHQYATFNFPPVEAARFHGAEVWILKR